MNKFLILTIFFIKIHALKEGTQAFCHVPVTNLYTDIPKLQGKKIPWDEGQQPHTFPRASQLLYNEQVTIINHNPSSAYTLIEISHFYYKAPNKTQEQVRYYVKTNALTLYTKDNSTHVPPAISYKNKQMYYPQVATLLEPYIIENNVYSIGTRFTIAKKSKNITTIWWYNPVAQEWQKKDIPSKSLISNPILSAEKKRQLFVSLLKQITRNTHNYYPYVFGGASLTYTCTDTAPILPEKQDLKDDSKLMYYRKCQSIVPEGIDCSHLITRIAQIAQIDIFEKNTTTFLNNYKNISSSYTLQEGDYIVWKGHCIIISDITHNKAIEARGYNAGYGKIQEVTLSELFKNISTYEDLRRSQLQKENLERLDSQGKIVQTITSWKLIKLI